MRPNFETNSLSPHNSLGDAYLVFLSWVLLGYALFGKWFAYIGLPPIYIGEAALLAGVLVVAAQREWRRIFELPHTWVLFPLVAWGVWRTIPYIGKYQVDALRDAAVFGYSAFAIIVAVVILADPSRLSILLDVYRKFWRIFLIGIPITTVVYRFYKSSLPTWPWADVPIIYIKEADVMVHLAAILAFWVAGFEEEVSWIWYGLMAFCVATIGVVDRSGMLAFLAVGALCMIIKPRHQAAWRLIAMCVLAVVVLWVSDVHLEIPGGKGREVSFQQLAVNVGSMLGGDTGERGMDSNKDWRLRWWTEVVDYTFNGPYKWTGKGFGINLADDDGFQLFQDKSLRSPHSAHITFLARGGVPGLALWIAVLVVWAYGIFNALIAARRRREPEWEAIFSFIGAFGIALLINASFDVYLEGPMGGIWFWCVYGFGLAALWMFRECPAALTAVIDEGEIPTLTVAPIRSATVNR